MYVTIRKMYHHPTLYFLCMYVVIGDYEHERILASERTGLQQLEILGEMKEIINMPLITPGILNSICLVTATIPNSFPWARADKYEDPIFRPVGGEATPQVKPFIFAKFSEFDNWLAGLSGIRTKVVGGSSTYSFTAPYTFRGEFWKLYGLEGAHSAGDVVTINPVY